MAHKSSHGGKGCEVGADTPHARRKKGFANTSSRMSDELGYTARVRGALAFGSETIRFRAVALRISVASLERELC